MNKEQQTLARYFFFAEGHKGKEIARMMNFSHAEIIDALCYGTGGMVYRQPKVRTAKKPKAPKEKKPSRRELAREEFCTAYADPTKTATDLAAQFNVSNNTVGEWAKAFGLPPKNSFNARREKHREEFSKDYAANMSNKQLSDKYSVSSATVYKWISVFGLPQKVREIKPAATPSKRVIHLACKEDVIRLFNSGEMTRKQLSEHFQVNYQTIATWIKRHGL